MNIQTQRLSLSLPCIEGGAVIDVMKRSATFGDVDNLVDSSRRHFAVRALPFREFMNAYIVNFFSRCRWLEGQRP